MSNVMESPFKGESGVRRLVNGTRNSVAGLSEAIRHEGAFRMELVCAAIAIPVALWLAGTAVERALLVGSVLLVLVVELVNSAIEAAVDRISLENHHLAKRAKDIGSAAVMMSIANAAVVWLLVVVVR